MKWPLMKNTISILDKISLCYFILKSKRFTQGYEVKSFEAAWSKWLGCNYSVFVNSGSSANLLLLDAVTEYYNIPKGSKILVPTSTWTTTVSPIVQLGFEPIFCDTDIKNFGFNLEDMKAIASTHKDIKVIFVAHLLGLRAPIEKYKEIFPEAVFLEDTCESHGIQNNNCKSREDTVGSTFSFYFGHHMTTIEGGMISTNNYSIYNLLLMKRSHGLSRESLDHSTNCLKYKDIDPQFLFITTGYNFRNTELSAYLGKLQLKKLDGFIQKRRQNYDRFINIISKTNYFILPDRQEAENSSFCFPFICKELQIKEKLKQKFKDNGIEYRPVIAGNLLNHPAYSRYKELKPVANFIHTNGLYIGNNQFVSEKDFLVLEKIIKEL